VDFTPQFVQNPRNTICLLNVLAVNMWRNALAPLARLLEDADGAARCAASADRMHQALLHHFWDPERRIFVDNRPWLSEIEKAFASERVAAQALLYGLQPPGDDGSGLLNLLARASRRYSGQFYDNGKITEVPLDDGSRIILGRAYPPNTFFRYWALAHYGRTDLVLEEWAEEWAAMGCVRDNLTMPEMWDPRPDTMAQFAHCATGAVTTLYRHILGLMPLEPGFRRCLVRPQLGGMPDFSIVAHTPQGPVRFRGIREDQGMLLEIKPPANLDIKLELPPGAVIRRPCLAWIPDRPAPGCDEANQIVYRR